MEKKTSITFSIRQVREYAIFIAQLVREGVTFDCRTDDENLTVILTGGF